MCVSAGVFAFSADVDGAMHFSVGGHVVSTVYRAPWAGFDLLKGGPLLGAGLSDIRNMTCTNVAIYPSADIQGCSL
jgi:hypothetical protein